MPSFLLWLSVRRCSSRNRVNVLWDGAELIWAGNGKTFLRGVGVKFLNHPFFVEAFNRLLDEYAPRKKYKIGLFLVCAYGKPYSQSYIHYEIIRHLKMLKGKYDAVHQIVITNAGIVPRELEEYYPFCCYDWNPKYENDEIKQLYSEVLAERIIKYIQKFQSFYEKFACYLRWDSDSYKAIKQAEEKLKMKISNLSLRPELIPNYQIESASLGVYDYEEDLVLITPKNLAYLIRKLKRLFL